jgi:HSP20 family molecular chaperone IbpA
VSLVADVDADGATAAYEDGMLIVELPLAPPKRGRSVPIDSGRTGEDA